MQAVPHRRMLGAAKRVLVPGLVLAVVAALLLGQAHEAGAQGAGARLPDGFFLEAQASGQAPFQLTDFAFLPGGGLLTVGKSGRVTVVAPDGGTRVLADLPVVDLGDRGLLGIALANDYARTGHLYLARTVHDSARGGAVARISRWTATPPPAPTALGAEVVVLDGIASDTVFHSIGQVLVAADGALYIGVGDAASAGFADPLALRAQSLAHPHGKILRVLPNGDGHPDNPFYDAGAPRSWRSRTFALGLRNPFRFTLRGATGALYVGDVGWNDVDEISVVRAGANLGWPCWEGPIRTPGHRDTDVCRAAYAGGVVHTAPVWHYGADLPPRRGSSVTGGAFYEGTSYPPAYRGAYVFGDYVRQVLWTAAFDDRDAMVRPPEAGNPATRDQAFGRGIGAVVAVRPGPDGDLHLADIQSGAVLRLRHTSGNRPPEAVASVTYTPDTRRAVFTGSRSFDPDGDALAFSWDFGDGSPGSTEPDPVHDYPSVDDFTAVLTVRDARGATSSTEVRVPLDNHPPVLTLHTPGSERRFRVGDTVQLRASASDREDTGLDAGEVRWRAVVQHCRGRDCHAHPGVVGQGETFDVPFADHGDETSLELTASVTDSRGATTTATYVAPPALHRLALRSDPAGATLQLNGAERGSGLFVAGSTNGVLAPPEHLGLPFAGWSDAGERGHSLTLPDRSTVLTALYGTPADRISRVAGPERIATAAALAQRHDAADTVVLARADDHADALVGGPLAARSGAPVLLTGRDALPEVTGREIRRLGARRAYVVGGAGAVGERVVAALGDAGVEQVVRLAGPDRYATAARVAEELGAAPTAYVVGTSGAGGGWADAVAVSGLAGEDASPVLLTTRDALPAATAAALTSRSTAVIVGGEAAVSAAVADAVAGVGPQVERLAGATRYETSAAVSRRQRSRTGDRPPRLWLATGRTWPDALAAGPESVREGGVLLLVDGADLAGSPGAPAAIRGLAGPLASAVLVGGTAAVSDVVEGQVRDLFE